MLIFILALLLILVTVLALSLEKTYFYLPKKELKRQAVLGDSLATTLFRASAYGQELKLLLWLTAGLSAAGGIVLFARVAPPLFGFIAVAVVLWLCYEWLPRTRLTLTGARIAEWCTPGVVQILRILHPVLKKLSTIVSSRHVSPHTGLYEREDLEELFERQERQSDNRISGQELIRMQRLLQFGHFQIADAATPRQRVIAVDINEVISPVRVDELHKSGHQQFPVYDGDEINIVGTLALDAITDMRRRGSVRDYYDSRLSFVHEGDSLQEALQAFSETHQHLSVVVNNAEEYVGIITLTDILQYLAGVGAYERFGRYDDRTAVVERHRRKAKPPRASS